MQKLSTAIIAFFLLGMAPLFSEAKPAKPVSPVIAEKEGVVLMPLRLSGADKAVLAAMEASIVKGLQLKYKVYSGEAVEKEVKKSFEKESAKKDCDGSLCIVDIAVKFKVALIAIAQINKSDNNYFLVLSIKDVQSNEAIFSETLTCKKCDASDVVDKLKELSAMVAPAAPVAASPPVNVTPAPAATVVIPKATDTESLQWVEVQKGNSVDDYEAYLAQYPKGKYAVLAKGKIKKIKEQEAAEAKRQQEQAAAESAQQDQHAWENANTTATQTSYQSYLNNYPQGSYANLANARLSKLKKEETDTQAKQRREQLAAEAQQKRQQAEAEQAQRQQALTQQQQQAAAAKTLGNGFVMVRIPGKNYEMGKYEVTQKEWRDVMGSNPSNFTSCGDNCPVEQVSWDDIQTFLQKLNAKTGKQYRLPTEAEWEYACYGGSQTEYCGSNDINAVAWYKENSNSTTHPVGQKQANGYGLHDMSGNVWEWQQDWYGSSQKERALRGGSWNNGPQVVRAANRNFIGPSFRINSNGFRLARTLP